jgi:ribose-phosphate pyrophosphokinase
METIIKKITYPDGSFYCEIDKPLDIKEIVYPINNYNDLWFLNQIIDIYKNLQIQEKNVELPKLVITSLLDSQHDRRFEKNQSYNLLLVCDILKKWNGKLEIFHPHNPELIQMYLSKMDVTIITNMTFVQDVIKDINSSNLILMSPDAGAYKNLVKLANDINWNGDVESAVKSRKYFGGNNQLFQQIGRNDFGGADILIVDDISVYGGTFIGISNLLSTRNIGKLYLAVSHLTVLKQNDTLFNNVDKVFTTNSKYEWTYYTINTENIYNLVVKRIFNKTQIN